MIDLLIQASDFFKEYGLYVRYSFNNVSMLFNNVIRQTKIHQFTNDDKPKSKNPFKILALIITNPN